MEEICDYANNKEDCIIKIRAFRQKCFDITAKLPEEMTNNSALCADVASFRIEEGKPIIKIQNPYDFEDYDDEERAKKILFDGATTKIKEEEAVEFIKENFEPTANRKLAEHGLTNEEEFKESFEESRNQASHDNPIGMYGVATNYIEITPQEIHDVILKHNYQKFKKKFQNYDEFRDLEKLKQEAQEVDKLDRKGKILLFDKAIHAQHVTGNIFDFWVNDIKEEVDEKALIATELAKVITP